MKIEQIYLITKTKLIAHPQMFLLNMIVGGRGNKLRGAQLIALLIVAA